MKNNVLVVHGGGPTAVMNASLYGVIKEAEKHPEIGTVYGAIGGMEGIVKERLMNLTEVPQEKIELLLQTPGSSIGSSRYPVTDEDYKKAPAILKKYGISYILPNGGNGTMDTCGKIYRACQEAGYRDIKVVGIPKTIDNDIAITDHTPGFGSAARYLAASVQEVAADVKGLPIHVCVIEALGRNAGWITAASALARKKPGDAPHLIYTPERPFNEEEFLEDVKALYDKLGGVVVVVSEGLKKADGTPIVEPIFKTERAIYYGDVSSHLANLVVKRLGIKARSEKPGLCGRASGAWQSPVDRDEAILAGEEALRLAMAGHTGVMVGFEREETSDGSYKIHTIEIPIEQVMLLEKTLPDEYLNIRGNDVTEEFVKWCRPLAVRNYQNFSVIKNSGRNPVNEAYLFEFKKRFDVPRELGGVNSIAPVKEWGSYIVKNTQEQLKEYDRGQVDFAMFFPEMHLLGALEARTSDSPVAVGCQGIAGADVQPGGNFGAFTTGRPAAAMKAAGCDSVIIGHCEERNFLAGVLGEAGVTDSDAVNRILNREVKCAAARGLKVLYCIGEKSEEQEHWQEVLGKQLEIGLEDVDKSAVVIAYEPVWSIGPGKTPAGKEYITMIADFVKKKTEGMDVVYGGGLKQENAEMLASIPEIDGGLIALTRFSGEIGWYQEEYLDIIRLYLNAAAK